MYCLITQLSCPPWQDRQRILERDRESPTHLFIYSSNYFAEWRSVPGCASCRLASSKGCCASCKKRFVCSDSSVSTRASAYSCARSPVCVGSIISKTSSGNYLVAQITMYAGYLPCRYTTALFALHIACGTLWDLSLFGASS